ncbi:MAG TPA: hypothetical protein VF498_12310 [Anaerolineales bacterium]
MNARPGQPASHRSFRPLRITLLGALLFLQSLTLLAFDVFLLVDTSDRLSVGVAWASQYLPLAIFDNMLFTAVPLVLALLGIWVALALMRLKSWAWMAAMILQGLGLLAALVGYIQQRPNYIGMLFGIILVLYLNQQEVQAVFRENQGAKG